jgi:AraC-like DNA-binding protein
MNNVTLYAFGRSTACGAWYIDTSRIVCRLYFVNRGSATVRIAENEWHLSEGHFYILPRSDRFVPTAAQDFDHTYFDFYSTRILRPDRIIEAALSQHGAAHFLSFVNTVLTFGEVKHEAMQSLLRGFLSHIEDALGTNAFIANEAVANAVAHIHTSFATVSTRELAERAHLCESYFIRLFTENVGLSPLGYIRARRVLHAKTLLARGLSVEAAAEACGYASPSALYKAVRAETGKAPSALKAKKRK